MICFLCVSLIFSLPIAQCMTFGDYANITNVSGENVGEELLDSDACFLGKRCLKGPGRLTSDAGACTSFQSHVGA